MNAAQRKLTVSFSAGIALALLWGLGTYALDWYKDATAPAGVLSEAVFLHGRHVLLLSIMISILLAICFAVCYARLKTKPAGN